MTGRRHELSEHGELCPRSRRMAHGSRQDRGRPASPGSHLDKSTLTQAPCPGDSTPGNESTHLPVNPLWGQSLAPLTLHSSMGGWGGSAVPGAATSFENRGAPHPCGVSGVHARCAHWPQESGEFPAQPRQLAFWHCQDPPRVPQPTGGCLQGPPGRWQDPGWT